jgi:hypothetical protein
LTIANEWPAASQQKCTPHAGRVLVPAVVAAKDSRKTKTQKRHMRIRKKVRRVLEAMRPPSRVSERLPQFQCHERALTRIAYP